MTSKSKTRYILRTDDESSGPKLCAFYGTDRGCKNGSSCKFLHSKEEPSISTPIAVPSKPTIPMPISVPMSNSSTTPKPSTTSITPTPIPIPIPVPVPVKKEENILPTAPKSEKKKRKSSGESESDQKKIKSKHGEEEEQNKPMKEANGTPKRVQDKDSSHHTSQSLTHSFPVTPFHPPTYRPSDDDEDESSFLIYAVNSALTQQQIQTPEVKSKATKEPTPKTPKTPSGTSVSDIFLQLNEVKNIDQATKEHPKSSKKSSVEKSTPKKSNTTVATNKAPTQPVAPAPVQSIPPTVQSFPFYHSPQVGAAPTLPTPTPQQSNKNQQKTTVAIASPSSESSSSLSSPTQHLPTPLQPVVNVETLVDPRVSDWSSLVQQCTNHSRFAKDYTFSTDSEWIQAKPFGEWAMQYPPIIAIDCEMCETIDPVTESKNPSALIRVSFVSGLDPSEVLLDSLVAPNWPISEMRTRIHGIAETNLVGVTFTLRHAQAFLMKVCSAQTILIGHALHHDLRALKFQHKCVIDTSYLFTIENEPNSLLGLRDIAKHLFNQKLSIHHDSVQDAQVALTLALHVKNNGPPAPIPRSSTHSSTIDETMLFIHRLPVSINEDMVREMIISLTNIVPIIVNPINHSSATSSTSSSTTTQQQQNQQSQLPIGKTNVVFSSASHANLCFETLSGLDRPDKGGRSQKRIYLKGGGYICVRKA